MKHLFTLALLICTTVLFAQKKLVDNSAASNSPSNGPSYLIVSEDDSKMTYLGNGTQFFFIDIPNYTTTSTTAAQFTEVERVGNVIFGRGKVASADQDELIYATTEGVTLLDYYTTAANFPRIWTQTGNGAYFGSGKFMPDNAGRDFIRVSPDLSTVTRPFNNVSGGGVDLINKNLYQVQMVPFAGDKILVKAKRTSSDEEYFVWDDTDQTSIQITDVDHSNADATSTAQWPLGKAYGDRVIFFYYDKIYTSDGTAAGTTEIADASGMHLHGIGGGSNFAIFGNAPDGDLEPYLYTDGGTPQKIDLNASGSSDPRDFRQNGDYTFFIANTGDGYEPHISDGTVAGTKLLLDINPTGGSLEPVNSYNKNNSIEAGNGFAFGATDGTNSYIYFTDGVNIVTLNNGEDYLGLFTSQPHAMAATEQYLYFTDNDKDVFRVTIPDNIYNGAEWSQGAPVAGQSLYFNADYTISEDLTLTSAHIPEGVTLTITSGATLTIDGELYNKGTINEDGGTLVWNAPISLINLAPVLAKVNTFMETAEAGFEVGQYPSAMMAQLSDSLSKANDIKANPESQEAVDAMAENLNAYFKEVLWAQIQPVKKYRNNLQIVLGDMKQAQIKNSIATKDEIDFLLIGMRNLQVDGIRIDIFGEAPGDSVTLNPNKEIYDYLYTQAKAHGFKIFANPAEFGGGRRIANNNLDELGDEVNGVLIKSNRLRDRIIEFAAEYEVDYISPFNEDCVGAGGGCFNASQVKSIYSALVGNVNGATIVGGDNHNLQAGINAYKNTEIRDYISVATCHNLMFQHDKWSEFMTLASEKGLPVWDSEATDNPKDYDKNGTIEESRMVAAIDAGVDGLVYYNNWATIDLENGNINAAGIAGRDKYIEDNVTLVSSISITGATQVDLENTTTLTASLLPADAHDTRIHWSSSDESKATVDQDGVVTAIDHGDIQIIASAIDGSGVSDTFNIRIGDTFVTAVTLSGQSEMQIESTQQLTATVSPEDATNPEVTWTSSDTNLATVDATGLVTAVDLGEVTITATSTDGTEVSGSFSITINPILAEEIFVDGSTVMDLNSTATTQTLTAVFTPSNTTNQSVVWSSDNTDVATVNAQGEVTAIAKGTAIISATAIDGSTTVGTIEITVTDSFVPVTSVAVEGASEMTDTETQSLVATVMPENATDNSVVWHSANTEILTVNPTSGVVTAVGVGTTTVTATAADGSEVSDAIEITVSPLLVTAISITGNATMVDETTQILTAAVTPSEATNTEVTWSSSNTAIATVSTAGEVTAVAPGEVTITATANDGSNVAETFVITVSPLLVAEVTVTGETSMLDASTQTLQATVSPENASDVSVSWSSSDNTIATIDETGKVSAMAPGEVTLTATANDGSEASGAITVTVSPLLVSAITIAGETSMLDAANQTLVANVSPAEATDPSVTWSSSNEAIATVDAQGMVTARAVGEVTITATANDASGVTTEIQITISPLLVAEISISGEGSMQKDDTQQLTATVSPEQATDASVTWSSSDEAVASVDGTGLATAHSVGSVTITATANDGSNVTGSFEIEVKPILVAEITIAGTNAMMVAETQSLSATVTPTNATDASITWSSGDEQIATVDATGLVTAISAGTVDITATANDDSGVSASLQIVIAPLPLASNEHISVSIYPNPTIGLLNLELPNGVHKGSYQLIDVLGHTLLEGTLAASQQLDISTFEKGVYFLKLELDGSSSLEKVILK